MVIWSYAASGGLASCASISSLAICLILLCYFWRKQDAAACWLTNLVLCRLIHSKPVRYGSHLEGKVLSNFEL